MTVLLAGVMLGLAGSLHCVMMCGPLVAALHPHRAMRGALLHHAGRIVVYAAAGLLAGLAGHTLTLLQLGRALSVAAGIALLIAAAARTGLMPAGGSGSRISGLTVRAMAKARVMGDKSRTAGALAGGAVNAALPCGLLYAAMAAAAATASPAAAVAFMLSFGAGTAVPLIAVPWMAGYLPEQVRHRARLALPAVLAVAGLLLVVRGAFAPAIHAAH